MNNRFTGLRKGTEKINALANICGGGFGKLTRLAMILIDIIGGNINAVTIGFIT